jgi:mannose-6-phosphate isomerase-like protein (cupin superfamily)
MPIALGRMTAGHVTSFEDALAGSADGSAVTIGSQAGSQFLEQRAERIEPGTTERRQVAGAHEVIFVATGTGVLRLNGREHALEPETGVFVADGDRVELESTGSEPLDLVTVRTPAEHAAPADRRATVRYRDQASLSAGIQREFRLLVDEALGCRDVTQFVGVVPPGRAPMHAHRYEEVAFIVEGAGAVHWQDGTSVPVKRGSCIHFPPLVPHSLENGGTTPLRIMGVFHPAGSPASRVGEDEE